jgi:hypothetical protein
MGYSTMERQEVEAMYLTRDEVAEYLAVSKDRVYRIRDAGFIVELKGGIYLRDSVEAYRAKRGYKRGGRYPSN